MRWAIAFTCACWLLVGSPAGQQAGLASPAVPAEHTARAPRCVSCHAQASAVLSGPMATRASERAFATRAFGDYADEFLAGSCAGCHVSSCRDCHGDSLHPSGPPADASCLRCHRGYFTGAEYYGRAPREDHPRFQRGALVDGERSLKMLPDVHQERGLHCADCHTMGSLQSGRRSAKTCVDCHPNPSRDVPEHAIGAHLEKLECYACHSAWSAQEYGTMLIRPRTDEQLEAFEALPAWGPWRKSAYVKRQNAPPLGLNARGRVSPIRPQFILLVTDGAGQNNRLATAEWKAGFPHTVRRGTTMCSGCHDSPRRFLLEALDERIYLPDRDGLELPTFWNREGQRVVNGSFLPRDRHTQMNRKTPEYIREHLRQWTRFLERAAPSSSR